MPATRHHEVRRINGKRVASPEYTAWQLMRNRCLNPHSKDYPYYGGRGITIDRAWSVFESFLADMGRKPTNNLTLERKDGNKSYCKANCEWATRQKQSRNRAYVKLSETKAAEIRAAYVPGVTRQVDLAKQYGVCQRTISLIVRGEGWEVEHA
jgi:hypothetical protein